MIGVYRRIFDLLDPSQKRHFWLLIGLMLAMGLSDLAGVALILPFLAVVANPGMIESSAWLSTLYGVLGLSTTFAFLQVLGFIVFAIVMLSIGIRALTFYRVTLFSRSVAMTLGLELLRRYLAQPYEWFLSQHSADLGKSILQEVHDVVMGCVDPAVRVIANGIVLVMILGLLVAVEPTGAFVMGVVLCGGFALIYRRLQAYLTEIGTDRRLAKREKHQITAEAMNGIKEVKVLGLESAYLQRFVGPSDRVARHQAAISLIGEMPRYALEALAFGGMLLFTLYLLWTRDGQIGETLPVMGAFAFAGLKLLPTVQSLFKDASQMRFGQPALEGLHRDLMSPGPETDLPPPPEPVRLRRELRLDNVRYRYPNAHREALKGITLSVPAGTSAGFVGQTGAGKTTVMDILLGLIQPHSGSFSVDGTAIEGAAVRAWQLGIGYVPQSIFLIDDTIAANIAFGVPPARIDRAAVERAARLASLDDFVATLPERYETRVGEAGVRISGGQRQRIGIARALYRSPDVIVFDEATSALDTMTERAVIDAIKALHGQKTILMVTHRLTTVAHCDQIFLLRDGQLDGTGDYDALESDNAVFRSLIAATR